MLIDASVGLNIVVKYGIEDLAEVLVLRPIWDQGRRRMGVHILHAWEQGNVTF
jgi:hypothetical protein